MCAIGSSGRAALAYLSLVSVLVAPGGTLAPVVVAAQSAQAPAQQAPDGAWPRRYAAPDGAQVVVYEPQIESWEGQRLLTLHAAVSYTPKGSTAAQLGTITAESDTRVAAAERLVDFSSFRIVRSNFPNATREQAAAAVAAIKASMPLSERVIALDRVFAYIDASTIRPKNVAGVKADPPVVFFSTRPAVVVNIDGNPVWSPIKDNDLRFAV